MATFIGHSGAGGPGSRLPHMSMVLVPFSAEQDETGAWNARADLGPFGVVYGVGDTRQEAIDDLQSGVSLVFEDEGAAPEWLPRADVLAVPEVA